MNIFDNTIARILTSLMAIILSAQLAIDIGDIPITGQTLAILAFALLIKPSEIFIVLISYLSLAALGAPILAEGASGLEKILGPTAGYLLGFVVASVLISFLFRKTKRNNWFIILLLTTLGTAIIVAFGVVRLSMIYGLEKGIAYGFTPFWKGAIIKILIGSSIVYSIIKWLCTKKAQILKI